ncbi:helix-turn-helix transcriptional regulator [Methylobacterium sp. 174MFSha1.1]|uniref:helix-turn-helix domain-containing protein n=1 Tax=Methylobacterium sp. 174MFSha1.1 TaxID=1502749 RepID=UPI0015A665AC|nr:helix-turn-helix transcriptional regulator [Methylobacterium sp. 174MFSha1.1]
MNYAIGTRVRRAREAAGLTQEALAGAIDRSKEAISNIERGVNLPTIDTLQRICDVTGIPIGYMFDDAPQTTDALNLKTEIDMIIMKMNVSDLKFISEFLRLYIDKQKQADCRSSP